MSKTWIKLPGPDLTLPEENRESKRAVSNGSNIITFVAVFLIAVAALFYRLHDLAERPMHHDEANQAVRCGILQETGEYTYDLSDHHGPSLYYITLPFAWLSSGKDFAGTSEITYRIVPVLFGVGLILLLLPLADGMGRIAVVISALLTAISPGMVYYSRFYIQETLLVFFSLAAICAAWRYFRSGRMYLALLAGLSVGMMYATKETCVIGLGGMLAGFFVSLPLLVSGEDKIRIPSSRHLGIAAVAAIVVVIIFFSSFFTNMAGPIDSVKAYAGYVGKGVSGTTGHTHPWYYYIRILGYAVSEGGLVWTEGLINILALIGCIVAFLPLPVKIEHKGFARFIAVYTLSMILIYSLISYKTPWCALSFLHGMILLAGIGAAFLVNISEKLAWRGVVTVLLVLGMVHLANASSRVNGRFAADYRNPYAYVHTTKVFMRLIERIEAIADVSEEGKDMFIQIIAPPDRTWPLPWYLRDYSQVGYWTSPGQVDDVPEPSILITIPDYRDALTSSVENNYTSEYHSVREEVLLSVYIRKDLWEAFMETRK